MIRDRQSPQRCSHTWPFFYSIFSTFLLVLPIILIRCHSVQPVAPSHSNLIFPEWSNVSTGLTLLSNFAILFQYYKFRNNFHCTSSFDQTDMFLRRMLWNLGTPIATMQSQWRFLLALVKVSGLDIPVWYLRRKAMEKAFHLHWTNGPIHEYWHQWNPLSGVCR